MQGYIEKIKKLDDEMIVAEYEYLFEFGKSEEERLMRLEVLNILFEKGIFQIDI